MKPTINRFFCRDCGRVKILFQTEKEANRFLDYNANDIEEENGKRPVRSYYCSTCLGWHVTSLENWNVNTRITSEQDEIIKKREDFKKEYRAKLKNEKTNIKAELEEILSVAANFSEKYINFDEVTRKEMALQLMNFLVDYRERKALPGKARKLFHKYIELCKKIIR